MAANIQLPRCLQDERPRAARQNQRQNRLRRRGEKTRGRDERIGSSRKGNSVVVDRIPERNHTKRTGCAEETSGRVDRRATD